MYCLLDKVMDEKFDDEGFVALNKCIVKVTEEIEQMCFNIVIFVMMEFINVCIKMDKVLCDILELFFLFLFFYVLYFSEEMWERFGYSGLNL